MTLLSFYHHQMFKVIQVLKIVGSGDCHFSGLCGNSSGIAVFSVLHVTALFEEFEVKAYSVFAEKTILQYYSYLDSDTAATSRWRFQVCLTNNLWAVHIDFNGHCFVSLKVFGYKTKAAVTEEGLHLVEVSQIAPWRLSV